MCANMASVPSDQPTDLGAHPRPSLAIDVAVLTVVGVDRPEPDSFRLAVLVHRRGTATHHGAWALPGSFVRERERLAAAVGRTLRDKCGLDAIDGLDPRLLAVFDDPDRDDRGWVLSAAHVDAVPVAQLAPAVAARDDLALAPVRARQPHRGASVLALPGGQQALPFDHEDIVELAREHLRERYAAEPDPDGLLPEPFTLLQLRRLHEAVTGDRLPKDTFRRRTEPRLRPLDRYAEGVVGRPARLYRRREKRGSPPGRREVGFS